MKINLILLSVALNVFLVLGLVSPPVARVVGPLFGRADPAPTASASANVDRNPTANEAAPAAPRAAGATTWATLALNEPKRLVEQLRSAGLPEPVVRAVLTQVLKDQVNVRRRQMEAEIPANPYWSTAYQETIDLKQVLELREMTLANLKTINGLLGPAPEADPLTAARDGSLYGMLPPEKVEPLKLIASDYQELRSALYASTQGITVPGDREKQAFLEQNRLSDIQAILSPAEFEEYIMRSSSTGSALRGTLALFEPTEAEFRAIFQLQYALDQKTTAPGVTPLAPAARAEAQKQLTEAIRTTLEPSRQADYERTTDPVYRTAALQVARLELPKENATEIWRTQKDSLQRTAAIKADASLAAEMKAARLTELQQEATAKVTAALGGQRGFDSYKAGGGAWIRTIAP